MSESIPASVVDAPFRGLVWLIDDDRAEHSIFRRAFSAYNVELRGFFSVEEALRHRSKVSPRLALVDVNMPGGGGFLFLEQKADFGLPYLPVLMMSSSSPGAVVAQAYAKGASSFFEKPANYTALMKLVSTLVDYWFEAMTMPRVS